MLTPEEELLMELAMPVLWLGGLDAKSENNKTNVLKWANKVRDHIGPARFDDFAEKEIPGWKEYTGQ